jgi:hypothetical protein
MIFKNKHAYFVKNNTNNNTNTKNFELLNNDFIIEATFKFEEDTNLIQREYCVVGRVGYTMGIFVDSYKNIKWEWWETNDDGEQLYRDIYVTNVDVFNYNTIKVIKEKNSFTLYVNDRKYESVEVNNKLYDYSSSIIYIGASNPYCENNDENWFTGDISDIKIYNSSNETFDDLYLWFDFKINSNFKTFDKSGNGNHGEIFESNEIKKDKNIEYNKFARPPKIV